MIINRAIIILCKPNALHRLKQLQRISIGHLKSIGCLKLKVIIIKILNTFYLNLIYLFVRSVNRIFWIIRYE